MAKERTSIVGVAHIDYIQTILSTLTWDTLTKEDLLVKIGEATKSRAAERERRREVDAARKWGGGRKSKVGKAFSEAAYQIFLALKGWKLIEETRKNHWQPSEDWLRIRRAYTGGIDNGKRELFDQILRSGYSRPFEPQNFLLPIRNNTVSEYEIELRSKNNSRELTQKRIPLNGDPLQGVAFDDGIFVKEVLKANFFGFKVMSYWGAYFEFTNFYYDPKVPDRSFVDSAHWRLEHPTFQVYNTAVVSTLSELKAVSVQLKEKGSISINELQNSLKLNLYSTGCAIYILESSGLARLRRGIAYPTAILTRSSSVQETARLIFDAAASIGGLWIGSTQGMVTVTAKYSLVEEPTLIVLLKKRVTLETFRTHLGSYYLRETRGSSDRYVWIDKLRHAVCRSLRIGTREFNVLLTRLYESEPEKLELSRGGGSVYRNFVTSEAYSGIFEPFKYRGTQYRMLMMVVE